MAGGGGSGGGDTGGGTFDSSAWHKGGDITAAEKKFGSLDDFDVVFVRNGIEFCRLEVEEESGHDYHYLAFDRDTNTHEYVICIAEKSGGTLGYTAIEYNNDFADGEQGVTSHGYVTDGVLRAADELFWYSNGGMYLGGQYIKFCHDLTSITSEEVCRIEDGTHVIGSIVPGGTLSFLRDQPELARVLLAKNIDDSSIIEAQFIGDVGRIAIGAVGSANSTYYGVSAGAAYALSFNGHLTLGTASPDQDVVFLRNQIEVARFDDGAIIGGGTGGNLSFSRNFDGGTYAIVAKNANAHGYMVSHHVGDTAVCIDGVTGSTLTYLGIPPNTAFKFGVGGGVALNTNGADPIYLMTQQITRIKIDGDGKIGVFGHATSAQPTVTGSRGGNAALTSFLTAMAGFGWIIDGTSA